MYGSGSKEIAKIKCEGCRKFILYESIIKIYGPDATQWFDGTWRKKPHYYCRECYEVFIK